MQNLRTAFIRLAHENPETRSTLLPLVKQADKWEKMPKGWTDESRKQFWETLTGDVKHKVTKCIKEMDGKFDDPGAFCASLADRVDPGWRSRTAKSAARAKLNGLIVRPIGYLSINSVGREGESFKIVSDGVQTDYYDEDDRGEYGDDIRDIREYNVYRLKPLSGGEDLFPNAIAEHTLNQWLKEGLRGKRGLILANRRASEANLWSSVIRLANDRPELRAALLPLLK